MTTNDTPKGEPITLPPLTCTECGMLCAAREFHPFAACLMFKACHDGDKVRSNLEFVRELSVAADRERLAVAAPVTPEGFVVMPRVPTAEMLAVIRDDKWPADWERGKTLQREVGLDVVAPECNTEVAAGQYLRLIALATPPAAAPAVTGEVARLAEEAKSYALCIFSDGDVRSDLRELNGRIDRLASLAQHLTVAASSEGLSGFVNAADSDRAAIATRALAKHAETFAVSSAAEPSESAQNILNSWLDDQHPDDVAVDAFASKMRQKMAAAREKGRGGWNDKTQCSAGTLSRMLREHIEKGDPVDVANFAMMLSQRQECIVAAEPSGGAK